MASESGVGYKWVAQLLISAAVGALIAAVPAVMTFGNGLTELRTDVRHMTETIGDLRKKVDELSNNRYDATAAAADRSNFTNQINQMTSNFTSLMAKQIEVNLDQDRKLDDLVELRIRFEEIKRRVEELNQLRAKP